MVRYYGQNWQREEERACRDRQLLGKSDSPWPARHFRPDMRARRILQNSTRNQAPTRSKQKDQHLDGKWVERNVQFSEPPQVRFGTAHLFEPAPPARSPW